MKALVLTAPSTLAVQEVPTPQPAANEVLVRVRACGICGSDIHGWDGSSGRRRPPLIMGHEAAGELAAVGRDVMAFRAGDRVTFDSTVYCGACEECRAGRINLCTNRRVLGVAPPEYTQNGAFAEYLAIPERILHRLPDDLSFEHAAMVEPVSIAVHAVRRLGATRPDSAVVVGVGMIGLLVVQALRWAGAKTIIAVDLEPRRLALAHQLGATHTILSNAADVTGDVSRLTSGLGAHVVVEAVGIGPTVELSLQLVRRGGAVVLVGNLARTIDFPLQSVVTREITLYGSCGSAGEYPLCIDLIARRVIDVAPLISGTAPLAEGPAWFQRMSAPGGGQHLKILLQP